MQKVLFFKVWSPQRKQGGDVKPLRALRAPIDVFKEFL
jgi:hypothetical protein